MSVSLQVVKDLPAFASKVQEINEQVPIPLIGRTITSLPSSPAAKVGGRSGCHAAVTVIVLILLAALTGGAGGYLIYSGGIQTLASFIPGVVLDVGALVFTVWALALGCRAKQASRPVAPQQTSEQTASVDTPPIAPVHTFESVMLSLDEVLVGLEAESTTEELCKKVFGMLSAEQLKGMVLLVSTKYFPKQEELSPNWSKILTALASSPEKLAWEGGDYSALQPEFIKEMLMRIKPSSYPTSKSAVIGYTRALGAPSEALIPLLARHPQVFAELVQASDGQAYLAVQQKVCLGMQSADQTTYFTALKTTGVVQKVAQECVDHLATTRKIIQPFQAFLIEHPTELASIEDKGGVIPYLFHFMTFENKNSFIDLVKDKQKFTQDYLDTLHLPTDQAELKRLLADEILNVFVRFPEIMGKLFYENHRQLTDDVVNNLFNKMTPEAKTSFVQKVNGKEPEESPQLGKAKDGDTVSEKKPNLFRQISNGFTKAIKKAREYTLSEETATQRLLKIRMKHLDKMYTQADQNFYNGHFTPELAQLGVLKDALVFFDYLCSQQELSDAFLCFFLEKLGSADYGNSIANLEQDAYTRLVVHLNTVANTTNLTVTEPQKIMIPYFFQDEKYKLFRKTGDWKKFEALAKPYKKT